MVTTPIQTPKDRDITDLGGQDLIQNTTLLVVTTPIQTPKDRHITDLGGQELIQYTTLLVVTAPIQTSKDRDITDLGGQDLIQQEEALGAEGVFPDLNHASAPLFGVPAQHQSQPLLHVGCDRSATKAHHVSKG